MQPQVSGSTLLQQHPVGPPQILVKDLRPAALNNINTTVIMLEKFPPTRSEGGVMMCISVVADQSAAVHLQLWGGEIEAFQPGDIVRISNGIFSFHKSSLVLRAGKKGKLEKVGEFTMVFVENPNMSRLQWTQDPANPTQWVPVGLNQQPSPGVHSSSGGLLGNSRLSHPERP